MNEKEKMLAGELYDANFNKDLIKERYWVKDKCYNYNQLKQAGYKICIVSPELQHHSIERIGEFKEKLKNMHVDAVCTKRIDLWEE